MTEPNDEYPPAYDRFTVRDPDPNYRYRWCNVRDRAMLQKLDVGWEVDNTQKNQLPPEIASSGQSIANPGGGTSTTRGDLILMRIPKAVYEERVEKPRRRAAERQNVSLDTMVQQANDSTRKALERAGYKPDQIRAKHVFLEEAERKIAAAGQ